MKYTHKMISVIFCSKNPSRSDSTLNHYAKLLNSVAHELLHINNPNSLADGYNQAINKSHGDILIFTHDDITFLEPDTWFRRLNRHLEEHDIVGLAGTTRLVSAAWAQAGPPDTYGMIAELDGRIAPMRVLLCSTPHPCVGDIQALDGVFLAVRRRVFDQVRFDAINFDGFHCYDTDFCFTAYNAGFKLAVANDLPALHASTGSFDDVWKRFAKRFIVKHATRLPNSQPRPFQHSMVFVHSAIEALEIMRGFQKHWHS